jgi:hypothetical protein
VLHEDHAPSRSLHERVRQSSSSEQVVQRHARLTTDTETSWALVVV